MTTEELAKSIELKHRRGNEDQQQANGRHMQECRDAAAELRRLHADNQVMLQALRNIIKLPGMSQGAMIICTAAILQATGEMP